METLVIPNLGIDIIPDTSTEKPFIVANTISISLRELENNHIIPVFVKDNEPVISHQDFINSTLEVVHHVFPNETILKPVIRVSHPMKGRIPSAKDKPAKELLEHEKTLYFERMAFVIEVPSISESIDNNGLSLTIGGVKSYNLDNLYSRKGHGEHFKIFIGFQNKVCCNLCVWSDGLIDNLSVSDTSSLMKKAFDLFTSYNSVLHLEKLKKMTEINLSEHQFATLVGRSKMYTYLPNKEKNRIPLLLFGDNQISMVAKEYYKDESFCRNEDGSISLWNVFNLFTGANKQSYIDSFLNKGVNAQDFISGIHSCLELGKSNWFLS